ncbi:MAG TPA: ABC transporter permease subunit [Fimbriimonas sp.]|nr:ABC transporter permease subunit [Fimbriimonas sp.]
MKAIVAIAGTTVGEAIRRKVLLIILLVGLLVLFIAPGLGTLSARSETTVLRGMMLGIIQLTSAVIAIVLTVYMLPNEVERRTIYTILSKPVQRWQFLVGKYLGAIAALALMMALMGLVMVITFWLQQGVRDVSVFADLLKAPVMYFIQMSLLAAVAIFFSTFVSPLVNFFLSGGVYLLGSLFNPFFQTLQENQSTSPVAKGLATFVNMILPNFANYNVQNPIINPGQTIQNEKLYYLSAAGYGIFYIVVLLVLGILVFDRREV